MTAHAPHLDAIGSQDDERGQLEHREARHDRLALIEIDGRGHEALKQRPAADREHVALQLGAQQRPRIPKTITSRIVLAISSWLISICERCTASTNVPPR
jgi:hypothetical protein